MKKNIMLIIMTIVVCIVGTSYAAYKLKASQISFSNNELLESNDVQSALDELSSLASTKIKNIEETVNDMNELEYKLSLCNVWHTSENVYATYVAMNKYKEYNSTSIVYPIDLSKYNVKVEYARVYGSTTEYKNEIVVEDLNGMIRVYMKANSYDLGMVMMSYEFTITSK